MKILHFWLCCLLFCITFSSFAQQDYTVNGETYTLNTEVEGTLTLLWNIIDGEYRYFSKKGNDIQELKNTKENGAYQYQYRETLAAQTTDASISTDKVNLTLPSLATFFNTYNKAIDSSYETTAQPAQAGIRIGGFAGLTNRSVINNNTENAFLPTFGVELEVIDKIKLVRHSAVLRLAYTAESSDYEYSGTQLSLNYRYKFIKKNTFDIYINLKGVTYSTFKTKVSENENNTVIISDLDDDELNLPGAFGFGADIALGKGYLTINYDDIVALNTKTNDEFPINLTVGYKIGL